MIACQSKLPKPVLALSDHRFTDDEEIAVSKAVGLKRPFRPGAFRDGWHHGWRIPWWYQDQGQHCGGVPFICSAPLVDQSLHQNNIELKNTVVLVRIFPPIQEPLRLVALFNPECYSCSKNLFMLP